MKKKIIIVLIVIAFIIGFVFSLFLIGSYLTGINQMLEISIYACQDGCSIATKDSNGFLTNETWDCWDKCIEYIKEIKIEGKK